MLANLSSDKLRVLTAKVDNQEQFVGGHIGVLHIAPEQGQVDFAPMPEFLKAIGFLDVDDEKSLQSTLAELAAKSRKSGDGSLISRPLDMCQVRIHVDQNDHIDSVSIELDGPEQTLAIYRSDEVQPHGWLIRAFTCIECRPVAPITVVTGVLPIEFSLPKAYFTRLTGIVHTMEPSKAHPGDMALGPPSPDGSLDFIGILLSKEATINRHTGQQVTVATLALPALILSTVIPPNSIEPGSVVQCNGQILASICDPVP